MRSKESIQRISVIVPQNPFAPSELQGRKHCLCALNVEKLMEWWPGTPHSPHRDPNKVRAIQRSLDWKRVAQIGAYLLQREIVDVPEKLDLYFRQIYEPKKNEPGREWPPKITKVMGFQRSEFPTFSNVLLHVNGARIVEIPAAVAGGEHAAKLIFDEMDKNLNFAVIDGQHRINGAYLAIRIRKEEDRTAAWEIPAEVFLDLDLRENPPRKQAQIFIDVNFYQKKVDRSLVADLFPTARGPRGAIDAKERSQDIGRKLMLETGPLVGMIQIPGIKYGVKDVVTLATLNSAIEGVLDTLEKHGITSLEGQTQFIAQCLTAWFEASGRFESPKRGGATELDPENVVYQGRVLVSVLALIPAIVWKLKKEDAPWISDKAFGTLTEWFKDIAGKAGLLEHGVFIGRGKFKELGYLGSGGIGRFRDSLWAAIGRRQRLKIRRPERISAMARKNRDKILSGLLS
jgi:DGQHR domain-containing protein